MSADLYPDPREARLPRWAQEHLALARRQASDARQALANAMDPTPTRVASDPHASMLGTFGRVPLYVPDDRPVRFSLEQRDAVEARQYVDVRLDERPGDLRISGSSAVLLEPHVSNSLTIRLVPR